MSNISAESCAPDCVITIPCFRERERLPPFLRSLCATLQASALRLRVLVVDDGSGTTEAEAVREIVARLRQEHGELLLEPHLLPENRGKGGAVYAGWDRALAAAPRSLCLVDADGSVPPEEVRRVVEQFHAGSANPCDALFAARMKMLGRRVDRQLHRHLLGRVFATAVTGFTGVEIYDSQCGLKVVSAEAYAAVAPSMQETGFVFDVELALALLQRGFHVQEVPIDWYEVPGSKVRLVRDSLRMLRGLARIRQRHGRFRATGGGRVGGA